MLPGFGVLGAGGRWRTGGTRRPSKWGSLDLGSLRWVSIITRLDLFSLTASVGFNSFISCVSLRFFF